MPAAGVAPTVTVFGECMLELSGPTHEALRLGYGGDTLNVAVYLARLDVPVSYATALGADLYSERMLDGWRAEGIDTAHVLRVPGRLPGLYAIETDAAGERRFHFWRGESAARGFFAAPQAEFAIAAMVRADVLFLSLVGFSILQPPERRRLLAIAHDCAERGGRIAFDSNFRPQAWPEPAEARAVIDALLPAVQWALPTFEDEQRLYGDGDPRATAARLIAGGAREVAVKHGPAGAWLQDREAAIGWIAPPATIQPVDTTGAGDAFDAAYLAARLRGRPPAEAARAGCELAGIAIRHRGAIAPREAMPSAAAAPRGAHAR